jgi:hypothetical protein
MFDGTAGRPDARRDAAEHTPQRRLWRSVDELLELLQTDVACTPVLRGIQRLCWRNTRADISATDPLGVVRAAGVRLTRKAVTACEACHVLCGRCF